MPKGKTNDDTKKVLRKGAKHIRIAGFVDYRRYLLNLYRWTKKNSHSYSYIQFSLDTGLGKSNASSLIIKGQRNLSDSHAAGVAKELGLRGGEASYFQAMVRYSNARSLAERDAVFNQLMHYKSRIEPLALSPEQIPYFESWLNPVIKELASWDGFPGDPEWIQEHMSFPVRLDEVKRSLNLLSDIGFLIFDAENGRYERRQGSEPKLLVDDLAAIRYHQAMIEAGKESLTRISGPKREVSGCTAFLSQDSFNLLKERLKQLVDEVEKLESQDRGRADNDVYQVNVQMFPFTVIGHK